VLLSCIPCLGGCKSDGAQTARNAQAAEGRALFGGSAVRENDASDDSPNSLALDGPDGWGIVLQSLAGEPTTEQIRERLASVQRTIRRSDIRVMRLKSGAAIVLGSYDRPDSALAKRDLKAVRAIVVGRQRPYSRAFFAPPIRTADSGDAPQYNLSTARSQFRRSAIWTFQIAVYESPDREEAKRAAEQAAIQLRREIGRASCRERV